MRAMVLETNAAIEQSPLRLMDLPHSVSGPGEVRIRVKCCGVCRTDLHVIEGDLPEAKRPIVPGHQIVGIVDQVGPACSHLKIGDRVGVAWLRYTCGRCRFCTAGRENLCPSSRYTGYHADGGYAEFATVPEDFAYRIPESFDDLTAAPLLCAGIIGYRALKRTGIGPGGRLLLIGFGSSAHVVLQIAIRRGCEVVVVSRSPNHQKLAMELGAKWAGGDVAGMPTKADAAILFAPSGALVPRALESLEKGGTLALAGIHMSPIPAIDYDSQLFGERDIHPVAANTRQDGRELLAEAAGSAVRPHVVTYPLERANQALLDMKADRIDGTAVLTIA